MRHLRRREGIFLMRDGILGCMADGSVIETIFKTNPFIHEGITKPLQLSELHTFLLNQKPDMLQAAQQRALIPIAAETSVRSVEGAIAEKFQTGSESLEITIRQQVAEALTGKRELNITQEQFEQAVTKAQKLDPKKNKRELERLGRQSDRHWEIVRQQIAWETKKAKTTVA
jgi:hypothetical protein